MKQIGLSDAELDIKDISTSTLHYMLYDSTIPEELHHYYTILIEEADMIGRYELYQLLGVTQRSYADYAQFTNKVINGLLDIKLSYE